MHRLHYSSSTNDVRFVIIVIVVTINCSCRAGRLVRYSKARSAVLTNASGAKSDCWRVDDNYGENSGKTMMLFTATMAIKRAGRRAFTSCPHYWTMDTHPLHENMKRTSTTLPSHQVADESSSNNNNNNRNDEDRERKSRSCSTYQASMVQ